MASVKSESSMNGLTIHKVARDTMYDSTAAQDVLAAMQAAGPNELFILEDEPDYYTVIPYSTTLQALIDKALSGIKIAQDNFVNSAYVSGTTLYLGKTAPSETYTTNDDLGKTYLSTQPQNAQAYYLSVSYPWNDND